MNHQIYYTGLKAVDLFAPIPLGGNILITGEPKSGPRVLGTELAYRFAKRPGQNMHVVVFLDSTVDDAAAYQTEFKETVAGGAELVTAASVAADDIRRHLAGFKSERGNAVFAVTKNQQFIDAFRKAVKDSRGSTAETQQLTSFVVTEVLAPAGFDASIKLIRALAVEGIYPPLDVRSSSSSALAGAAAAPRDTANSAKAAISDLLGALPPGGLKDPAWIYNQDPKKQPVVQAARFLSQPYFCAEPYTGLKSAYVPIDETVENFRRILAGSYLEAPLQSFYMKNGLPSELAHAAN